MNAVATSARRKQAGPTARAAGAPAVVTSRLASEAVDQVRRQLLAVPRTAATLQAIEAGDLRAVTQRSAAALEQLLAVARGRRRILSAHKTAAAVPVGIQRYQTLLLADALAAVQAALPEWQRLAVRLEVSGLNGDLSRLVVGQWLDAKADGSRSLRLRIEREEPKAVAQLLAQAGLSPAALDDLRAITSGMAETLGVDVWAPGDEGYPGAGADAGAAGGAGGGGGGVGGSAVDAALGGLRIPKGLSGLVDGAIENVRAILDGAVRQDWTYGFALADGTPTMRVDFGPRGKDLPPTAGGQMGAVGGALREIGGRLFVVGLAIGGPFTAIGVALYLIGLLLGVIGMAWDALASGSSGTFGFVDP